MPPKKFKQRQVAPHTGEATMDSVIELTDSDSNSVIELTDSDSVVELTDSDLDPAENPLKDAGNAPGSLSNFPLIDLLKASHQCNDGPSLVGQLSRFAFQAKPARMPTSSSSTSTTLPKRPQFPTAAVRKGYIKNCRRTGITTSNRDLSRLEKCVCCQLKWTVPKNATQKLRHIRKCSRKYAQTDETVSALIRKELLEPSSLRT